MVGYRKENKKRLVNASVTSRSLFKCQRKVLRHNRKLKKKPDQSYVPGGFSNKKLPDVGDIIPENIAERSIEMKFVNDADIPAFTTVL